MVFLVNCISIFDNCTVFSYNLVQCITISIIVDLVLYIFLTLVYFQCKLVHLDPAVESECFPCGTRQVVSIL